MGEIVDLESFRAERLRRQREEAKRKERRRRPPNGGEDGAGGAKPDPAKDDPA